MRQPRSTTPLKRFVDAMEIKPVDFIEEAERIARRLGVRRISRQHYGRLCAGRGGSATEKTMFLIVATLQSLTGLAVRAADVFAIEPALVPPGHRRLAPEGWLSVSSASRGAQPWVPAVNEPPDKPSPSETLEYLYREHAALLRTTAKLRYRIPDAEIESLVNDVFVSFLERQPRVDDVRAYLLVAIGNASKHYHRKRRREQPLLPEHEELSDDSTVRNIDRWALHLSVGATLAHLGERCRETLRRFYLDDEETSAIAERFSTSPGYIRQLLHECRKRAREIYRRLTDPRS